MQKEQRDARRVVSSRCVSVWAIDSYVGGVEGFIHCLMTHPCMRDTNTFCLFRLLLSRHRRCDVSHASRCVRRSPIISLISRFKTALLVSLYFC